MKIKKYKATIKAINREVEVFKNDEGEWTDYSDIETVYEDHELDIQEL
jgi:hypothetical protein